MRACATGSAVFAGLLLSIGIFSACSGGPGSAEMPPAPDNAAPPPPVAASADTPHEVAPPPPPRKEPTSAADCKEITGSTSLVNEPPGNGTVMNNAATSGDAGASDRLAPMMDAVKARRDGFRCCFDIWSKNNPGQSGRILMVWALKPDGAVDKVTVDATKSTLHAPEVEACMVNLAAGLSYPPSPTKKLTTFSYPFEFRAKK